MKCKDDPPSRVPAAFCTQTNGLVTLQSFSIISSMLTSPFWDTLDSMLVSHSQSSLYFSLNTVHSFSFSPTCCLRRDSCRSTAAQAELASSLKGQTKSNRHQKGSSAAEISGARLICFKCVAALPVRVFHLLKTGCSSEKKKICRLVSALLYCLQSKL